VIPGRGRSGALVALLIAAAACSREPAGSKGSDALAEAFAQALARDGDLLSLEDWLWTSAFRIAAGMLKKRREELDAVRVNLAEPEGLDVE
jgi:hypothetical protein